MQPKKRIRLDTDTSEPLCRFDRMFAALREARAASHSYKSIKSRLDDVISNSGAVNELERGHLIMDTLRENLAIIDERWKDVLPDFDRNRDQRKFHDKIIASAIKFVYGKAFGANEIAIKKYNKIKSIKNAIAFTAPRRFGKSLALGIIIALFLVSIPGMEICVITQNSRSADKKTGILDLIKQILKTCFDITKYETCEKEHLIFSLPDKRAVHSYSAGVGDG